MKRHFLTGLKAFAVGALAFAAVSCYDDQPIWDEIEGLKDRVTALEEKLNTEVATINTTLGTLKAADEKLAADIAAVVADVKKVNETLTTLDAYDKTLDGKIADLNAALAAFEDEASKQLAAAIAQIAVVKAEKNEAGNYVLTFADGKTLEVAAADANANNTGVITTVEVDGVTYWAVIGADGEAKVLDAAVHPDTKLQFKVDPETNELLVAYDGKTWEQTGVIVNDDTTFNVVTDFEDGEDYVTITVGGEEYQLPKYVADNSSLVLGRAEAFFAYGASKSVELAVEDIEEYYVMSKPDGWKASIDGTTLTVTAPAEALVTMGAGEAEGEVLIHATTLTGTCKVVKFTVTAGPAMKLSYKDGEVTFFSALTTSEENWDGSVWTDFSQVWYGLVPIDEFIQYGSFEALMASEPEALSCLTNIMANETQIGYVEGEVEEFVATMSLADIVENSWAEEFEYDEDETYLMWIAPSGTTSYKYDEAIYVFTDNYVDFEATDSLYNNVNFAATLWGSDEYIIGATSKSDFSWVEEYEDMTYEDALMEYLQNPYMANGPFDSFLKGDKTAMGTSYKPGNDKVVKLSDALLPGYYGPATVDFDTEYFVWILPYSEGKELSEYTLEDLIITTCQTTPLTHNPAITATATIDTLKFDKVTYTVIPPTNGTTAYEVIEAEHFDTTYVVDGVVAPELLAKYMKNNWAVEEKTTETQAWNIEENTAYVLALYNRVAGEYSVQTVRFTTPREVELPTPDKKQWMFTSEYFDMMLEGENSSYCFDLGVAWADLEIEALKGASVIAVDYGTVPTMAEQGAPVGSWFPAFPSYGVSVVVPTDEESGVIEYLGSTIPYTDFDGEVCTFDISELLGEDAGTVVLECTLAEEVINIQAQ